jgi:hypothetical protein
MTLPTARLRTISHRFFGCHNVEDTKEIARLRAQSNPFVDQAMGGLAADQFARGHNLKSSSHKPEYFSNVCVELPAKIKWKVVRIEDWSGGGPEQLVCIAPMEAFDVGQQAEASPAPGDEPSCWWVNIPNE